MVGPVKIFLSIFISLFAGFSTLQAATLADGHQLYQTQRYTEALAIYTQVATAGPQDAQAQQALGNALVQLGRREEGLQAYERCLQLKPDNAVLKVYVERLRASLGVAAPVSAASPEEDERLAELLLEARGLLEAREMEAALKIFDEGAKARPQDPEWAKGQAEVHYAKGEFAKAREAMTRARKLAPDDASLKQLQERYYHAGLEDESKGGNPFSPLWRSALLPGWGQTYNGQKAKGFKLGALTLGLLAGTAATYIATNGALDDYRKLGAGTSAADFDAAFNKADSLALTNQVIGLCFYGVYAYNLFDAAAYAKAPSAAAAAVPGTVRVALLEASF